jgi:hypothetical protein
MLTGAALTPARCAKLDLMTKSAKQDTEKTPAQATKTRPAATESAATQTENPVPAADNAAESDNAAEADKQDLDETKRKFREALERKNQTHSEGQDKGGRDGSKINGAHGPAASRRSFRRKSG